MLRKSRVNFSRAGKRWRTSRLAPRGSPYLQKGKPPRSALAGLPDMDPDRISEKIRSELLMAVKDAEHEDSKRIWNRIRTRYRHHRIMSHYQIRIKRRDSNHLNMIKNWCLAAFVDFGGGVSKPCKVQIMLAYVLHDRNTEEERLFYASENTTVFHGNGRVIRSQLQLKKLLDYSLNLDEIVDELKMQNNEVNYQWYFVGFASVTIRLVLAGEKQFSSGGEKHDDDEANQCHILPATIRRNHNLLHFLSLRTGNLGHRHPNLCIFRAIYYNLYLEKLENMKCGVRGLFRYVSEGGEQLAQQYAISQGLEEFYGPTTMEDIPLIEECFTIKLHLWESILTKPSNKNKKAGSRNYKSTAKCVYTSVQPHATWKDVHLFVYGEHVSVIKKIETFARTFICNTCDRTFDRRNDLEKHSRTSKLCGKQRVQPNSSPWYNIAPSLLEQLTAWGYELVDSSLYWGVWDCETCQIPSDKIEGEKLQYYADLQLVCIAYQTNVSGFENAVVHMDLSDPGKMVRRFLRYVDRASREAKRILCENNNILIEKLRIASQECLYQSRYNPFKKILRDLEKRIGTLKMFGF